MAGFKMDDYVDVAQRIKEFYERFPEGSLRTGSEPKVISVTAGDFIVYHAQAWRSADDPLPADGWAWEPIPGPTSFTLNSELMNAETAAWGRAIVALGFSTKKIASQQEVRARQTDAKEDKKDLPPIPPSLETLHDKFIDLCTQCGYDLGPVRKLIEKEQQKPGFEKWLQAQVDKAASDLEVIRQAEAEKEMAAADREAQVESPAFVAPTGKRGEKAAA